MRKLLFLLFGHTLPAWTTPGCPKFQINLLPFVVSAGMLLVYRNADFSFNLSDFDVIWEEYQAH